MFNQFGRTLAAIACTVVFSATCVLGAVGPAASPAVLTMAERPTA